MTAEAHRKILIICALDRFANSVRPRKIKAYLEQKGHQVEMFDILEAARSTGLKSRARTRVPRIVQHLGYQVLLRYWARGLERAILQRRPDIVICETYHAAYVFTRTLPCVTVLDLPAPHADELYFSGEVPAAAHALDRRTEQRIFDSVDFLTFHWASYNEYVKKRYTRQSGYAGENMFELNWGCTERSVRARFDTPARVVFVGNLGAYWVNLPLLSALSEQYPIDVYGAPPPDEKWGLNYRGYAPHLDVLAEYQFGLITITDDALRREGFSSKHLEYLSYGLPVLCPEWRHDRRLADVTIPFNEENFLTQVREYSEPEAWHAMQANSIRKCASLAWERQLRALDEVVEAAD